MPWADQSSWDSFHYENLPAVKPKNTIADWHCQLHSNTNHHERTYQLSSQECQEQINTINFILGLATIRKLTSCHTKNARSRSTPSTPLQFQAPWENLLAVKQECPEEVDPISFIPATATLRELTF
jgi:hypothetical protein